MGMDVIGIKPISEAGEDFRANVWSWRIIHSLMMIANDSRRGTLVARETYNLMGGNNGAGLSSQKHCDALADAMEKLIEHEDWLKEAGLCISEGFYEDEPFTRIALPVGACPVTKDGAFIREEDLHKYKKEDLRSAYSATSGHVQEFIGFLRNCGGFQVY